MGEVPDEVRPLIESLVAEGGYGFEVAYEIATRDIAEFSGIDKIAVEQLESDDAILRRAAVVMFTEHDIPADIAVPALIPLLDDVSVYYGGNYTSKPLNLRVALVILGYGPDAEKAAPELLDLLESGDLDMRGMIAQNIWRVGPVGGVIDALADTLNDDDRDVCLSAVWSLKQLALESDDAFEVLEYAGDNNSDEQVRDDALKAIAWATSGKNID